MVGTRTIVLATALTTCGFQATMAVNGVPFPMCSSPTSLPQCTNGSPPGSISSGPPFVATAFVDSIVSAALGSSNLVVLVAVRSGSGAVFSMDSTSGARTLVSGTLDDGTTRGAGPMMTPSVLSAIAVAPDGTIDVLTADGLFQIDPVTGDRTLVVTADATMICAPLTTPLQIETTPALAATTAGAIVVGSGAGTDALIAVTPAGCTTIAAWTEFSTTLPPIGSGPAISAPMHIAVSESVAYAMDIVAGASVIETIDLQSGDRATVAVVYSGASPTIQSIDPLAFGSGALFTSTDSAEVQMVDVVTGVRTDDPETLGLGSGSVVRVIPHPTGWPLAFVIESGGVLLWDLANGDAEWFSA